MLNSMLMSHALVVFFDLSFVLPCPYVASKKHALIMFEHGDKILSIAAHKL